MNPLAVAIVVNGVLAPSAPPARLVLGHVMVPLAPIVGRFVDRAVIDGDRIVIVRGTHTCRLTIGGTTVICDGRASTASVVPFASAGSAYIAVADIARALQASATYVARTRTLSLVLPRITTLGTPLPFDPLAPQVAPVPVFTPTSPPSTPQPQSSATGVPRPRRTAIPETPSRTPS